MKKLFNTRLLAVLLIATFVTGFTACTKEDDDVNDGSVQLFSFGPTGARPGDTLRFIGVNLNKVTAIQFTGTNAIVEQKNFIQQNSNLILLLVPQGTERGYVTLKTTDGDIVTKTQLNLRVAATVSAVTPPQARPGENITITGNYLNWVSKVTFARDKEVTTFVSKSLNQLVVRVPDDAQTGPLRLTYQGTDSGVVQTDTLRVVLPVATSFSPNPVKHGDNVTITGTNLDLTKQVIFNGVSTPVTSFVSQSATQLVVRVPGGTQSGKVTLVPASGVQSVSATDLNVLLPSITTMAPNPVDPGANLTITGTNLDLVSSVAFQNAPAVTTFVSQSPTQLVVRVPTGVTNGRVTLGVKNSTLTVQSPNILEISGAAPPPVMKLPIYNDAVTSNWNGWIGGGWGGTSDLNNTSPVRAGTKSIRINYVGGYGSPFQLGGANISLAPYTSFKFSVYGAPGSGGKRVTIGINGVNGKFVFTVVEGKWTDYEVPLSTLTSESTLKEIWIQEYSGTGGFTIYVDAIGLN